MVKDKVREVTVLEYAELMGFTKDKVLYKINKGELKARKVKDGKKSKWLIQTTVKPTQKTLFNGEKSAESKLEIDTLKLKLAELTGELKGLKLVVEEKEKTIQAKDQTIMSLVKTVDTLEKQTFLLEEKTAEKSKSPVVLAQREKVEETPKKDKNPPQIVELMEYLKTKNLNSKQRQMVRSRFNSKLKKEGESSGISKNKKGQILINLLHNFEDLLKV